MSIISISSTTSAIHQILNHCQVKKGKSKSRDATERLEGPIHVERCMRIVVVGAGASSLFVAYKLQKDFKNISLTLYEKNPAVAGSCFEPRVDWSSVYPPSEEIYDYFNLFAQTYNLHQYDEYHIHIKDTANDVVISDHCNNLINAGGALDHWCRPDIAGLDNYKGSLLHTTNWDETIELQGKHVGLIDMVSPAAAFEQRLFSEEEKSAFGNKSGALLEYQKAVENGLNGSFGLFLKNHRIQQEAHAYIHGQMIEKSSDANLLSKLMPNEYPVDVLICATGFDTHFRPRFLIVSHAGETLQDKWATDPQPYLGVAAAGSPKYLTILGPSSPIGNGPVLYRVETQVDWICRLIDQYQTTNMKMSAPKEEAVQDFAQYKDYSMSRTNRGDRCATALIWPGSTLHYVECMKNMRLHDFEITYAGNRFTWLGNRYSQTEFDETADWAYYIRDRDDSSPLSTAGRRKLFTKCGTVKERTMVKYS
ncbi:hypothetical protein F4824DRAFT_487118 [Ustulina deusta]|nr:hypothetical protein F4824DRAFT_487118 [Ustulina deusta]